VTRTCLAFACVLALSVVFLGPGCGPSGGTASSDGAAKKAPPPRPGEDAMKEQMEKLLQTKGKLPKGVPDLRKK
jgi:hypothetical protein